MKIFISSLITGMEDFRLAARQGVKSLGHEVVMAEDFGAKPQSPQIACLQGLRESGLVILILGEHYGTKQANGFSATHQEYNEAKGRVPVIAFVQNVNNREQDEADFITEIQGWEGGLFRGGFNTAEQLQNGIIKAIHQWEISVAAAPLDFKALTEAAFQLVESQQQENNRFYGDPKLLISIVSGPIQAILRPSEIEKAAFIDELIQGALFGSHRIFDRNKGTQSKIQNDCLIISQDNERSYVALDPQGSLIFGLTISENSQKSMGMVILVDQLEQQLHNAFQYASWLLDKIDATHKLTHVSIAVGFENGNNLLIRTEAENNASPNSFSFPSSFNSKNSPVQLRPPYRSRSALKNDVKTLTEDFVTLLKRSVS
jgi:hypothetical protein